MDLFFSSAWAQDAAAGGALTGQLFSFLPIILIFAIFYFLIIRPQNEEAKRHAKMVAELKKGDLVVTRGGLFGEIGKVEDATVTLKAGDAEMVFQRASVERVLTGKDADGVRKSLAATATSKKR